MRMNLWLALTLALVGMFSVTGAAQFVPYLDIAFQWKTIETPHFSVTFHQGLEGMAQEAAKYAEESYEIIKKEFGKVPDGKVNIIIYDETDFSNGSANPVPHNTINLLTVGSRLAEWANVRLESWMKVVVFHELLHIMDLDMATGVQALLRKVFGRIIIPQAKPVSFIEGLAVYEKWKHLGESRLNDARTMMIMRTLVAENRMPSFSDMTTQYTRDRWPSSGLLYYNLASWFLRYLEETYGKDTMKKVNEINSSDLMNGVWTLFFGFGTNFEDVLKKATGKNITEIMSGYHTWLRKQFEEQIGAIKRDGVVEGTRLTTYGWQTNQALWSGDGSKILYRTSNPTRNGIRLMTSEGQHDQEIIPNIGFVQYPTMHPKENKIVYQRMDFNGPYYVLGDLYEYDLNKKKETRLTEKTRAYFSQFSPDGQKLYFAKHIGRDGSTAIAVMDMATKKIETVKEFPDNDLLVYSFDVSPDGQKLAISAWRRGGYQDIYLMPTTGGDLTAITQDKDVDLDPTWSPDGSYTVFSSDKGGVSNLYAYKITDSTFHKITNSLTGAYDPDISPDGKEIIFTGYTVDGYDVYKIAFDPNSWKNASFSKETIPAWEGYPKSDYPIHNYSPIWSLLPTLWLPIFDGESVGAFTLGNDVTAQHNYTLAVGYDLKHNQPFYDLNYTNTMLPLNIDISVGQSATEQHQGINVGIPLQLSGARTQFANIGYRKEHHVTENPAKEKETPTTETRDSETYSASYSYATASGSDLFRDLMNLTVSGSMTTTVGQEKPERRLSVNWSDIFRLPTTETQNLAFKMTVGWSDIITDTTKGKAGYSLGGSSGPYLLRGFKSGSVMGQYALASSIEYRFRVMDINKSAGAWPLFFDDLFARPFVDMGLAGDKLNLDQAKFSYGLEFRLTTGVGYFNQLAWRLGIAQGLGERAPVFYFDIGTSF
jgi:Tol biopolymer transport system component